MGLTLRDHIRREKNLGRRSKLLRVCDDAKDATGVELKNARLRTREQLGGALGMKLPDGRIELAEHLVQSPEQTAELAVTAIHEGFHAPGRRASGKHGQGIRHEGITELAAQKVAQEKGYRGFSKVYESSVKVALQIGSLLSHDLMMELADRKDAPVLLQQALTRALVRKHSMPTAKAAERARQMERAAA